MILGGFLIFRKILQLRITILKQIGGFFHIIKKSPNHKSGNWSQLGKECTYTNFSQTNLKKEQKLLGKYIEIRKIPPIEHVIQMLSAYFAASASRGRSGGTGNVQVVPHKISASTVPLEN